MRSLRLATLDDRAEMRRRRRARDGRVTIKVLVECNNDHMLELSSSVHPLPMVLTEQNILEIEAGIAAWRERVAALNRGPQVLFPRSEAVHHE